MRESVAVAKEADRKQEFLPINTIIHHVRDEHEMQLGSLGGVIGNIRRDGGKPSVESIATELASRSAAERAPALIALQQTHGNRYVQRVVSGIQTKLMVGQPGDMYEQEADQVADEVMRMPEPQEVSQEDPHIQRVCLGCEDEELRRQPIEEEEEEELLQTKEISGQNAETTPDLESRINAIKGGGKPLSESERAFFEPRFGHEFSQVRVHTDTPAAESARAVNARAYTVGRNVVFGGGQYALETSEGRRLLAHELTHVVQQDHSNRAIGLIQRDLLIQPPRPNAVGRTLTEQEIHQAIRRNNELLQNAEIVMARDVLGLSCEPVVDEAFVRAVVQWQAEFGFADSSQDGILGRDTARTIGLELSREAEYLEARGTAPEAVERVQASAERFRVFERPELVRRLTAIVLSEAWYGQEGDIAWIYYNRIYQYGEEDPYGLNASAAYGGRTCRYKMWYTILGQSGEYQLYSANPATPRDRESCDIATSIPTIGTWVATQRTPTNMERARRTRGIVEAMFRHRERNPHRGWIGQGNLSDINGRGTRGDTPYWRQARQYFRLQRNGTVTIILIRVLLVSPPHIGRSQFIFDYDNIREYFSTHNLPRAIPPIHEGDLQVIHEDHQNAPYVTLTNPPGTSP